VSIEIKNIIAQLKSGELDPAEFLSNASPDQYNLAASAVRKMNDFQKDHPILSKMMGNSNLVEYIDQKAYDIASISAGPARNTKEINEGTPGTYTGSNMNSINYGDGTRPEDPNMLKIFLGMEDNVLPISSSKPSSWTKGDPEQGWRSIKEYSRFDISDNVSDSSYIANIMLADDQMDFRKGIQDLTESVKDGTYNPSEHAVAIGEDNFPPGIAYDTDIDLANFTKSIGYDAKKDEYYMSITDVWDFEGEQYSKNWKANANYTTQVDDKDAGDKYDIAVSGQSRLMSAAGSPVGIYDRYTIPKEFIESWALKSSTEESNLMDSWKSEQDLFK